jgi:hypothetical protein
MRTSSRALFLVLALAPGFCAAAQPAVSVAPDGSVAIDADRVPLSEVLDRFARVTGAELTWEGTPVRALVTLRIQAPHAAAALAAILEGQAIDFALAMDLSGTRVAQLIVGSAAASGARTAAAVSPPPMAARVRPEPARAPPPAAEEAAEPEPSADETAADTEAEEAERAPEPGPEAGVPTPVSPRPPTVAPISPGVVRFPVSPFAPQPTPLPTPEPTPKPF